jgi:hypothetical protein
MSEPTKKNPVTSVKNFVVKHERKILVTTTVVSTTAAVLMRTGLAQHNAFLKEKGLYEEFYALTEEA